MFRLIPARLHRTGYRMAHALRKCWWLLRQPSLLSVSVVATDADGQLLLVQLSYGTGMWSLPTGGAGRGEAPEDAARRELREETGCDADWLEFLGMQQERIYGCYNTIHVFAAQTVGQPEADQREVIGARFFPLDSLPQPLSDMTHRRLSMWRAHSQ